MQQATVQLNAVLPGNAVVFVPVSAATSNGADSYQHAQSKRLGVAQIIVGILCMILNIVILTVRQPAGASTGYIGYGFWNGILYIVCGAMGVSAGTNKTRCKIVAFMVLCIIAAISTITLLSFGIIGAIVTAVEIDRRGMYFYSYGGAYVSGIQAVVAMHSLLAVAAVVEGVTAIWGSVICCKAVCCCSGTAYQAVTVQYFPNMNAFQNLGEQMIAGGPQLVMPNQQVAVAPSYGYDVGFGQASWIQPPPLPGNMINNYGQAGQQTPPPSYPSDQWNAKCG